MAWVCPTWYARPVRLSMLLCKLHDAAVVLSLRSNLEIVQQSIVPLKNARRNFSAMKLSCEPGTCDPVFSRLIMKELGSTQLL